MRRDKSSHFAEAFEHRSRADLTSAKCELLSLRILRGGIGFKSLPSHLVVSLEPETMAQTSTARSNGTRESRVAEYFARQNFTKIRLVDGSRANENSACRQSVSRNKRGAPLKRIYEVQLQTPQGQTETRCILAKSVGLGWLGYHAFLAGHRSQPRPANPRPTRRHSLHGVVSAIFAHRGRVPGARFMDRDIGLLRGREDTLLESVKTPHAGQSRT